MAEPLKNFFDPALIRRLSTSVRAVYPAFPEESFLSTATRGLTPLSLLERAKHIAAALRRALPTPYEEAIEILLSSLGPELSQTEELGMGVFFYLPHVSFVEAYGLEHFEASMKAQYELTKRFSAEFSIRAFLEAHPTQTLERLHLWVSDPSPHVRRLVSEGTRPRLPWARRLPAFQKDPDPVLALLEKLKDDPVLYVRRSVANNLNDIGKDHPDIVVSVCERWGIDASEERRWLIRHALRSLVKRGDISAMSSLGYQGGEALEVTGSLSPSRAKIGGQVAISLTVQNKTAEEQRVIVDLAVHFIKASGRANPKVFKIKAVTLAPNTESALSKTISLKEMTTRRHYPGRHNVEALLNGRAVPIGGFELSRK